MDPRPDDGGPGGFDERVRELLAAVADVAQNEWQGPELRRLKAAAERVAEAAPPRNTGDGLREPVNGGAFAMGAPGGVAAAAEMKLALTDLVLRLSMCDLKRKLLVPEPLQRRVLEALAHAVIVIGGVSRPVAQAAEAPPVAVTIAADQDELAREAGRA